MFPQPAHRALERHLGAALGRCGDLLASAVASLLNEGRSERVPAATDAIDRELWAAGGVAAQSRYPSRLRRHPTHPRPHELLHAVERLWHSLLLLARAGQAPLPEAARRDLAPALAAFPDVARTHLGQLGDALKQNAPAPSAPTGDRVRELDQALHRLRQRGSTRSLDSRQAERVFTLAFAIQELNRDFDEVTRLFSGAAESRG